MLCCKDCNYYRNCSENGSGRADLAVCDFADVLFIQDTDDLNVEYPCNRISFEEYLRKQAAAHYDPAAIQKFVKPELFRELKECGVCMLKFPDGLIEKCFQNRLAVQRTDK